MSLSLKIRLWPTGIGCGRYYSDIELSFNYVLCDVSSCGMEMGFELEASRYFKASMVCIFPTKKQIRFIFFLNLPV